MRWTCDLDTGALYFVLGGGEAATQRELAHGAVLDLAIDGRPVGLEIYEPAGRAPALIWANDDAAIDGAVVHAMRAVIGTFMPAPGRPVEPVTASSDSSQIGELIPA